MSNKVKPLGSYVSVNDTVDNEKLMEHVRAEYSRSLSVISAKRQHFRNQEYLYNTVGVAPKLDLHTVYTFVNAYLAQIISDEVLVDFLPRQIGAEYSCSNLRKLARYDMEQMSLHTMNYEVQLNRLLRGVGIRFLKGFNKTTMTNEWSVIDTRQWVPDPNGYFDKAGFAFEGFESMEIKGNLRRYDFKNVDMVGVKITDQNAATEAFQKQSSLLNMEVTNASSTGEMFTAAQENERVEVYHHFTYFDRRKWHVVLANGRTVPLAIVELEAVYDDEKKDPSRIPYPTVHNYLSPKKGDPYGISLVDLLQVPHIYKNMLAQYGFLKEKDAAIGTDILFDNNVIQQKGILGQPSLEKRFIGVDGSRATRGLNAVFAEVPITRMAPSNYDYMSLLDNAVSEATGFDKNQLGLRQKGEMTFGMAQQLQANNNVRQLLVVRNNNIGERDFWKLNIRSYRQHFGAAQKKLVRISGSTDVVEFSRKDFLTDVDPDIVIESKAVSDAMRASKYTQAAPLLMQLRADPTASLFVKNEATRELLYLAGYEMDEIIAEYVPYTPDELDAMNYLELIKIDNPLGAYVADMNVDHNTYIHVFQRAPENKTKRIAIDNRRKALIATEKQRKLAAEQNQQTPQDAMNAHNNAMSMTQASMLNNSMQKNRTSQGIISKENM